MRRVRQIRPYIAHVRSRQIHFHLIGKPRRIDHRHRQSSIPVFPRRHVHLLNIALRIDTHRPRPREPKVPCKGPQSCRHKELVFLQPHQRIILRAVLRAPPVRVAAYVRVYEGIMHVQRPLEALSQVASRVPRGCPGARAVSPFRHEVRLAGGVEGALRVGLVVVPGCDIEEGATTGAEEFR